MSNVLKEKLQQKTGKWNAKKNPAFVGQGCCAVWVRGLSRLPLSYHFVQSFDVQTRIPQANSVSGGGAFEHPLTQILSEAQEWLWVGLVAL